MERLDVDSMIQIYNIKRQSYKKNLRFITRKNYNTTNNMANMEPKVDYSKRPTRYNKLYPENEELYSWLRKEMPEEIIEPERPIIDPHHHLWDRRGSTKRWRQQVYLLPEILEDVYDGHNVVATVFVQAGAFLYKQSTPPEFQGLGEVEFCQGIAAMTSSQIYGNTRINCGIQGSVDLTHPNCENVLKAMMGSRNFRGVRGYISAEKCVHSLKSPNA